MAQISTKSDNTILKIQAFLGLNENPDGTTTLKNGELSEMRNFRITQDRHLQIRPGSKTVVSLAEAWEAAGGEDTYGVENPRFCGVWRGSVSGTERTVVSYGGGLWDVDVEHGTAGPIGKCTQDETTFFGFGNKVYMLNGHEYKSWDAGAGHVFETVAGYVPLVQTATTPAGAGTLIENVNRLTPQRKVEFSPDGTSTVFQLPEKNIDSVDRVEAPGVSGETATAATTTISGGSVTISDAGAFMSRIRALGGGGAGDYVFTYSTSNKWTISIGSSVYSGYTNLNSIFGLSVTGTPANGNTITVTVGANYTVNLEEGTITFTTAIAAGTNTMSVVYSKDGGLRSRVEAMRFSEFYNGNTDTRVFLYGDGTNVTIYSGIDGDTGKPSAEYFPDLYEVAVGESNTPVTALVRHYSRLMAYKPRSAWNIQYGQIDLAGGLMTSAFYCQPVNRQLGNDVPGQVKLLENNPVSMDNGSIYQWRSGSNYGIIIGSTENNAKRVSDRVSRTFRAFDVNNVKTFVLNRDHEFWFCENGKALILNFSNDTWYLYENLPFSDVLEVDGEKYGFSASGNVMHFSRNYRNDDGETIDCYAATGSMDFERDWLTKYSPMIYVAMQPEANARITVTTETNRRSDYADKVVAYNLSTFSHLDFKHFSFATNRKPQVKRLKIKVKKATYYKLIFKSNSASATATVIETDVVLRYAGSVK